MPFSATNRFSGGVSLIAPNRPQSKRKSLKLEIDFLIQHGSQIVPIEAKAEENLRSKSLSSFVASHPEMHGLRFSMSDYREQEWMTNIPLYALSTYF